MGQIVAPALEYYEDTVEGEMGGQIRRMRLARAVFDPLHVKANGLSPDLIEDLFETYRSLVGLIIFLSLHSPSVPSCYCTHCASPPASVFRKILHFPRSRLGCSQSCLLTWRQLLSSRL